MGITRTTLFATALGTLLVPSLLVPSVASAAPSQAGAEPVLVASGLQGASGGTIGPDGALYVTEAMLGQVTRVDPHTGATSTFASGLPKAVIGLGGAIDVAFIGHTAYVLVTVVGPDVGGDQVDGIYRMDDADSFTVIADLGEYSRTHPPATAFDLDRGLQFALQPVSGGFLVSDGHHNRVLKATLDGTISEVVGFGNIVPTGLESLGNIVLMAEAGPVPHAPETGKVVAFRMNRPTPVTIASGFSLLVDVEFGRCGLYALSQGDSPGDVVPGSPALPNSGELLQVRWDGTFQVVAEGLNLPTSVDFTGDTAMIVTATGDVWKVEDVPGYLCWGGAHHDMFSDHG